MLLLQFTTFDKSPEEVITQFSTPFAQCDWSGVEFSPTCPLLPQSDRAWDLLPQHGGLLDQAARDLDSRTARFVNVTFINGGTVTAVLQRCASGTREGRISQHCFAF